MYKISMKIMYIGLYVFHNTIRVIIRNSIAVARKQTSRTKRISYVITTLIVRHSLKPRHKYAGLYLSLGREHIEDTTRMYFRHQYNECLIIFHSLQDSVRPIRQIDGKPKFLT